LGLAAWIQYLGGIDTFDIAYPIQDPLNDLLQEILATVAHQAAANLSPYALALLQTQAILGVKEIFDDMGQDSDLVATVARQMVKIRTVGVAQALSVSTAL
jgi:mannitol-1-phosphate/altronate dehydrogenase